MVNNKAPADFGAGVYFNARFVAAVLRDQAGQKAQSLFVHPMGNTVVDGGMHALIEQKDFQFAAGGRITFLIGLQSLHQSLEHNDPPNNTIKRLPYLIWYERRQYIAVPLSFITRACDGAKPGGACVPLAPGRTSPYITAGALSAGDAPSLFFDERLLFPIIAI
ncbi:hypothetical protein SDC9_46778 [bioreactor metagenome]|uniref:Uncharacterized protein n=1 Tax=bioreactor metagenome TaxID=1076179 RepID=A0A644W9Y0_9ZZZZ